MEIKKYIMTINKKNSLKDLSKKYNSLLDKLIRDGGYIWGTGRLGQFAYEQCKKTI